MAAAAPYGTETQTAEGFAGGIGPGSATVFWSSPYLWRTRLLRPWRHHHLSTTAWGKFPRRGATSAVQRRNTRIRARADRHAGR
jgi:hypothetical protein